MRQAIILATLLALLGLIHWFGPEFETNTSFDPTTLTSTGFILLAAFALGEMFRRLRLPALLGYLVAGIVFGPHFAKVALGMPSLAPISPIALEQLGMVNVMAVGVIGTMGGAELRIAELRKSFHKQMTMSLLLLVVILPAMAGLVLAVGLFLPHFAPFLAELPFDSRLAAALLLGTLAIGLSPSATLALLQEVRAHGRFTSFVLGLVVIADLVLVAVFLFVLVLSKLLVSPEGFSFAGLNAALPQIAAEFGWAILIGVIVGVALIAYFRFVRRELLLFSLGVIFVTTFVTTRLHAETLLAFLVAGFIVQNFSKQGHHLLETFESIALPVFVIYFATQAASLDLSALSAYLPLTLLLVTIRCGLLYGVLGLGARITRVDPKLRPLLQISFFSQGGVDLVLASMVAQAIPSWGVEVQTITVSTIVFYIIGGPPFLARALDRAGESAAARERGAQALESRKVQRPVRERTTSLDALETGDRALDRRLSALRGTLTTLTEEVVRQTVVARCQQRRAAILELGRTVTSALAPRQTGDDARSQVDKIHEQLRSVHEHVAEAAAKWGEPHFVPLEPGLLDDLFERVTAVEPFSSFYRITCEPRLFEPQGTRLQRALRMIRRIRRALFGPGTRTIALGRAWRYHVALDVPVSIWSTLLVQERACWALVLHHYRATTRDLEAVLPLLARPDRQMEAGDGSSAATPHHEADAGDEHDGESHAAVAANDPSSNVAADPRILLATAREHAAKRMEALVQCLEQSDAVFEQSLTHSLANAWRTFLGAVQTAGTLEHPSWRYRISSRYDAMQAARAELRERLRRDQDAAEGLRHAAATLAHAHRVAYRARALEADFHRLLQRHYEAWRLEYEQAKGESRSLTQSGDDSIAAGDTVRATKAAAEALSAHLERLSRTLQELANAMNSPESMRLRRASLSAALDAIPPTVAPVALPADDGEGVDRRSEIRLRSWLKETIVREFNVGLLDVEQDTARRLNKAAFELQHARQVIDYNLLSPATSNHEVDRDLSDRLATVLERPWLELEDVATTARERLSSGLEAAIGLSLPVLVAGKWEEVNRRLRRMEEGIVARIATADHIRRWGHRAVGGIRRASKRAIQEISAVFDESATPEASAAFRRLVFGSPSSMNDAYQRLFTSAPAESIGLVIERPEAAALRAGITRWQRGRGGPILVCGDHGVGKRTLVRQILGQMADIEPRWIRLEPGLEDEARMTAHLAQLTGWLEATRFDELARALAHESAVARTKKLLVVENAHQLFRRTSAGLARMRAFFDLVETSSDRLLWIIIVEQPAAHRLDPAVELSGRFPTIVNVPAMSVDDIRNVLTVRHRLSGYDLRFVHHSPRLHEWLRNPATAWGIRRGSAQAIFDRIWLLSRGNVKQALLLWLALARRAPIEDNTVLVGPVDALPDRLIDGLPLIARTILAALVLHGPLSREELTAMCSGNGRELDTEIARLAHQGFVTLGAAGERSVLDKAEHIGVPPRLMQPLTEELRSCNLL